MTTQARLDWEKPRSAWIDGSATLTIVMSRTIISIPVHSTTKAIQRERSVMGLPLGSPPCSVRTSFSGAEFAFTVGGTWTRWGYTFTPVPGGTQVTESWEVLPDGIKRFEERFGAEAAAQLANRFEAARTGIPATLAALKRAAEAG